MFPAAVIGIVLPALLLLSPASSQQMLSLEYNSQTIPNHSLLLLTDIGESLDRGVRCLTNRTDCCDSITTGSSGVGDWVFPSGTPLNSMFSTSEDVDLYRDREPGEVDLYRRNNATSPEGVYRCEIPVDNASQDVDVVYIGLYLEDNGVPVITDLSADSSSSSIICLSTGGPVTDITWLRNNVLLPSESADYATSRAVMDTEEGTYASALTVSTGQLLPGNYTCTVSNNAGNSTQTVTIDASETTTGAVDVVTTPTSPPTSPSLFGVHFALRTIQYRNNSIFTSSDISETFPLQCVTDKEDCCSGSDIGNWLYPNRTLVQNNNIMYGLFRTRRDSVVQLHHRENSPAFVGGIFECEVQNSTQSGDELVHVYAGIYPPGEGQGVPQVTSIVHDETEVMLTCTSTGGPASRVTWLREGVAITDTDQDYEMSQRILTFQDATYASRLVGVAVGSLVGNFTCIVENDRGMDNATLEVNSDELQPPVINTVSVINALSATISWTDADSAFVRVYNLSYTYMGACPGPHVPTYVDIDGDLNSHTITGLSGGALYLLTLAAVNDRGSSDIVTFNLTTLEGAPSGPPTSPLVSSANMTAIALTWGRVSCLDRNSLISGYRLEAVSRYGAIVVDVTGTAEVSRSTTLGNLIPHTSYTINIAALSAEGVAGSEVTVSAVTDPVEAVVFQLNGDHHGNNSIVDPDNIGEGNQALFCLTDRLSCCRTSGDVSAQGLWYDSNDIEYPNQAGVTGLTGFYRRRGESALTLNKMGEVDIGSGEMVRCEIPNAAGIMQNIYIGLFPPDSGVPMVTELRYDTLTTSLLCSTSGGPVTTVTWTQDEVVLGGEDVVSRQNLEVLNVVYHNTLELTRGREEENVGVYQCSVSNSRGSTSLQLTVEEPAIDLPDSMVLGASITFRCRSPGGVANDLIEWVNATGHVISMATDELDLDLVFNPADLSSNNTTYTCRISNHITSSAINISLEAPSPPEFTSAIPMGTDFVFMWVEPSGSEPNFFQYTLTCDPALEGLVQPDAVVTGDTQASITGFEDGATYLCSLTAGVEGYVTAPVFLTFTVNETVPTSSPSFFNASTIGPREVTFSWETVPLNDRNGMISHYDIICNSTASPQVQGRFSGGVEPFRGVLTGYRPSTGYVCWITASNGVGQSPPVATEFITADESNLFQIELVPVSNCFSWVEDMGVEKAEEVTAMIIDNVNQACPECVLTPDRITDSFWKCFPESPQSVTYRAMVHGTSDRTSAEVVTAIESLVRSDVPIRVLSVEYSFVSECEVQIFTEGDEKCQTSSSTSLLVPIVGGALGGVIVVTLCVIIVILAVVIRRKRRSKKRSFTRTSGRNLNEIPQDRGSVIYAQIPPPLPPSRPHPLQEEEEECTTFTNAHNFIGSVESLRYGPGPNPEMEPEEESDYAIIDEKKVKSRKRDNRRPSEYEIPNIGTSPTGSTSPPAPSSQQDKGAEEEEEERAMMKLAVRDNPAFPLGGNDYESIVNPHFRSSETPPPSSESPTGIDVIKNESYSEMPAVTRRGTINASASRSSVSEQPLDRKRAKSVSAANNPMYAVVRKDNDTGSKVMGSKFMGSKVPAPMDPVQNHDFVEYEVPPPAPGDRTRPPGDRTRPPGDRTRPSGTPGHVTQPLPHPSIEGVINNPGHLTGTPGHVTGTPAHVTQPTGINNPGRDTYDVPTPHAQMNGHPTYDVPTSHTTGHNMYDVPSNNQKKTTDVDVSDGNNHPHLVLIDILPLENTEQRTNPTFYKYDIPPSNLPAPKLNT